MGGAAEMVLRMTLDDLLTTCGNSAPDDWNTITCWGGRSGPSYLDQFAASEVQGVYRLEHREHGQRSAYRPDLSINIGWGLDPDEEWGRSSRELSSDYFDQFPDSNWSMNYCDFFYNGNLVAREAYAVVDGGRAILPFPDQEGFVAQWEHDWFRVLDAIGLYISDYDSYFRRAGLSIKQP